MLVGSAVLEFAYESRRAESPRWPTWKSLSKWAFGSKLTFPVRPSSKEKLNAMTAEMAAKSPRFAAWKSIDAVWQPYHEWVGFLEAANFNSPQTKEYWLERIEEERTLACSVLPSIPDYPEKIIAINTSELSRKIGSFSARKIFGSLTDKNNQPNALESQEFIEAKIADTFTVLIRFGAWLVADRVFENWEDMEREGLSDVVILQEIIPVFDTDTGDWIRPLQVFLDKLAILTGCPEGTSTSVHLGKIWEEALGAEPMSKQRLIRYWMDAAPGKPDKSSVEGLMAVLLPHIRSKSTFWHDRKLLTDTFRFAWVCHHIRTLLTKQGLPNELVSEVFSVYGSEYRRARAALGKPLSSTG